MVLLSVDVWSPIEVISLAAQMQHFFNSLSFYVNMNKNGHCFFFFDKFVLFSFSLQVYLIDILTLLADV